MITISKKVEYSMILISYLAKSKGETMSLKAASKKLFLPYRFLGQLAMELKQAGIIGSKEGKTGGYNLAKGWDKKTFYDLLDSLGENKHMVKCLGDEHCKRLDQCEMRGVWKKMEQVFSKELKQIKLIEL